MIRSIFFPCKKAKEYSGSFSVSVTFVFCFLKRDLLVRSRRKNQPKREERGILLETAEIFNHSFCALGLRQGSTHAFELFHLSIPSSVIRLLRALCASVCT